MLRLGLIRHPPDGSWGVLWTVLSGAEGDARPAAMPSAPL